VGTDWIRRYCLAFPHVTEHVQWEIDLVFKIGGRMFAIVLLEPFSYCLSMKCSADVFAELVERPGIAPAPYLARANWVAFESADAVPRPELEQLLRDAYEIVLAKLPKKTQEELRKTTNKSTNSAKRRPFRTAERKLGFDL
jgi:predicted DNA-binding protein (MmcQ/YjbR family)